ncbi:MAG: hypothetical protein Tsb004_28100 [Allomuricauda sp.]
MVEADSFNQKNNMIVRYILVLVLAYTSTLNAQYRPLQSIPDRSTKAMVSQRVGITDIEVSYYSPCARGRKIYGERVPYNGGHPFPWRAGANENTVVRLGHDVMVQGKHLSAGEYGLHIIPAEDQWTFIFSSSAHLYGSSYGFSAYKETEDVLRVTAVPESIDYKECLQYEFLDRTEDKVSFCISWENTRTCVELEVDLHNIVVESLKNELRGTKGLYWESWQLAAQYLLEHDLDLNLALAWIDRSISGDFDKQPAFANLFTKSQILKKLGRTQEAAHFEQRALFNGSCVDLYYHGNDSFWIDHDIDKAKAVFEMGINRDPHYSRNYLGMGWVHIQKGNPKKAIDYLEKFKELNTNPSDDRYADSMMEKAKNGETLF